jgi:hypothetical protein
MNQQVTHQYFQLNSMKFQVLFSQREVFGMAWFQR